MPKGKFTCKNCKKTYEEGGIWNSDKFKCAKHGELCLWCVDSKGGFFSATNYVCKKCGNKATEYAYSSSYGKWMKK